MSLSENTKNKLVSFFIEQLSKQDKSYLKQLLNGLDEGKLTTEELIEILKRATAERRDQEPELGD